MFPADFFCSQPGIFCLLHPKQFPLIAPIFGNAFAEQGAFLFDFLCQFRNGCHLARFQHIPILKTLYHRFLQGGHGFRIKFRFFRFRLVEDRFAAIVFQPDENGHFDIAVDQPFNRFFSVPLRFFCKHFPFYFQLLTFCRNSIIFYL